MNEKEPDSYKNVELLEAKTPAIFPHFSRMVLFKKIPRVETFWITNFSAQDVSLSDLNVTIRAYTSINLLDTKHHYITKEQISQSLHSGSLYRKKDKVAVRKVAPIPSTKPPIIVKEHLDVLPQLRSLVEAKEADYDELGLTDEDYANDSTTNQAPMTPPVRSK